MKKLGETARKIERDKIRNLNKSNTSASWFIIISLRKFTLPHDGRPPHRPLPLAGVIGDSVRPVVMETQAVACLVAHDVSDVLGAVVKLIREHKHKLVEVACSQQPNKGVTRLTSYCQVESYNELNLKGFLPTLPNTDT
jgi:hypothetical protein